MGMGSVCRCISRSVIELWRGRARVSFLLAVTALVVSAPQALAAGDANRTGCSAATESSSGFRTYLPDCRAYEMVSPPYKGGFQIYPGQLAASGVNVGGSSFGAFAGGTSQGGLANQYLFSRSSSGWLTTPLEPAASQFAEVSNVELENGPDVASSGAALFAAHRITQSEYQGDLYLREPDGSFVSVGPMLPASAVPPIPVGAGVENEGERIAGASSDLTHVLFSIEAGNPNGSPPGLPSGVATNLWPGDTTVTGKRSLYEYVGAAHTGKGTDVPSRVGVGNDGTQISDCGTNLAIDPNTLARGISGAGSTVLFSAEPGPCEEAGTGPAVAQLYARVGAPGAAETTVNLAGSSGCAASVECKVSVAPVFQGASADGSKVFFTTTQPLAPGDHDTGNDIYECELPGDIGVTPPPVGAVNACPSLHAVSVTGTTEGADVLSVAAVSEDGSRVYFVAEGVLTGGEENEKGEAATQGSDNLYVTDTTTARTNFIGKLSSSEPGGAQTTPDGRFLVFGNEADLTRGDSSTAQQVFEYDAEPSPDGHHLVRISIGDEEFNDNGNTSIDPAFHPSHDSELINQSSHPSVSNDGSKVVFDSADGLTPNALNHAFLPGSTEELAENVYEYSHGRVFLISDGREPTGEQRTQLLGIDGSGRDIYFGTVDSLVPQDTDQLFDIYDAREEGGFPAPTPTAECLAQEACQGPLGPTAALRVPGSSNIAAEGNLAPPPRPKPPTRAQKLAKALKVCRAKRDRHKRAKCESAAIRAYGHKAKARQSAREQRRSR